MEFPCISWSLSSSKAKLFFLLSNTLYWRKTENGHGRKGWFLRRSYKEELQIFVIFLICVCWGWGRRAASSFKANRNKTERFPPRHLEISQPLSCLLLPKFHLEQHSFISIKGNIRTVLLSVGKGSTGREAKSAPRVGTGVGRTTKTENNVEAHLLSPLENILFNMQTGHQEKRGMLL